MELLVHTESVHVINQLKAYEVSFVLTEPHFSYLHPQTQTEEDFLTLIKACEGSKTYLQVNGYLEEHQLLPLKEKLKEWITLDIQGFYFADPAVLMLLNELHYDKEKRYASETILTNAWDASVYLLRCSKIVLARELTFDEIINISKELPFKIETHGLGYSLMSMSKRPLVRNYLEEIQRDSQILNRTDLRIRELKRPQLFPILEEHLSTSVFSGDILYVDEEMKDLEAAHFSGLHCESLFMADEDFITLVLGLLGQAETSKLTEVKQRLPLGKAYFKRKTNLTKEEAV